MKLLFGDMVVVEGNLVGVIVKSWMNQKNSISHEVYVRSYNAIKEYPENEIERYKVRHKELEGDELEYQKD